MSDLTVAIADRVVDEVFRKIVDKLKFEHAGASPGSPVSLRYDVAFHFRNDTLVQPRLELRDDGTVFLHDLKILWDKLELTVGVDIPEVCVGGFCIVPDPTDGCLVRAPRVCLFGGNPDFSFTLALDQLVTSEISVEGGFRIVHFDNPARLPTDSDWDAHRNQRANGWQMFLVPTIVHVDPFHIADIVGDLFKSAIEDNVNGLLGDAPGWAKDLIKAILGGIETLIRATLNIGDDVVEWLENQLNGPVGLRDIIETFVADYLANRTPVPLVEDPMALLDNDPHGLIPVMVPITGLIARVSSKEVVLEGSVS